MLKADLFAVRAGVITWSEFHKRTKKDWSRLAHSVHRRWKLPAAVDVEDLEQELLLQAFVAVGKYQEGRGGMPFDRYVVWCAMAETHHWLHSQRNALRRSHKAPSRTPVSFTELDLEHDPEIVIEADQETAIACFQHLSAALRKLDALGRQLLYAVIAANGSIELAAKEVFDEPSLSRALRLGSTSDARAACSRVVQVAIAA